ncbi:unnamed protein product [Parajaminaea phylloscopi]
MPRSLARPPARPPACPLIHPPAHPPDVDPLALPVSCRDEVPEPICILKHLHPIRPNDPDRPSLPTLHLPIPPP